MFKDNIVLMPLIYASWKWNKKKEGKYGFVLYSTTAIVLV